MWKACWNSEPLQLGRWHGEYNEAIFDWSDRLIRFIFYHDMASLGSMV
jgi:hypothetical protein